MRVGGKVIMIKGWVREVEEVVVLDEGTRGMREEEV